MNRNSLLPIDSFIDELFGKSISDFIGSDLTFNQPSVNIIEADDLFKIQLAAPGLEKTDFQISIDKGAIHISSAKKEDEKTESGKYTRREFSYKSFKRRFKLPENIDEDTVQARYENGVLEIDLSKKQKVDSVKTIEIG